MNSYGSNFRDLYILLLSIGWLGLIVSGFCYQPTMYIWSMTSLMLDELITTWRSYFIPLLWLIGLGLDCGTGGHLGIGGCYLVAQFLVIKTLLARHLYTRRCLLLISSIGWAWLRLNV